MEKRTKKPYRNAIRSEKMIIRAYATLMQENDKITVTDIVNEADINRSTFYAHFKSIDDVREKIHSDVMDNIMASVTKEDIVLKGSYEAISEIVDFLESDEKFYKSLIRTRGADKFLNQLRDTVINIYLSDTELMAKIRDKKNFEIILRLFIGGYVLILEDWARDKLGEISLEDSTRTMTQVLSRSIQEYM